MSMSMNMNPSTDTSVNIIHKYLNFDNNHLLVNNLGIELNPNIVLYNKYYKTLISNPNNIKEYIREQITTYLNKKYELINVIDADINYYIEHINLLGQKKFIEIINELNITHIVSMLDYLDYSPNTNKNFLDLKKIYYEIFYSKIIRGDYKPIAYENKTKLEQIINDKWNNIDFDNFIEFTKTLNKIKYMELDIDNYIRLISDKFDSVENILKLLNHINKIFFEDSNDDDIHNDDPNDIVNLLYINNSSDLDKVDDIDTIDNINNTDNLDMEDDHEIIHKIKNRPYYFNNKNKFKTTKNNSKYNFRFIVDNLKSNGYLLFEEFNKQLKKKYEKSQQIETIIKDKKIINYFTYIISKKDSNSTNRKVNEILLRMRDYINDIEDSYNNNIAYQKITVKQESDKYKSVDLSSYNRTNTTFNIFKYSNNNQDQFSEFVLNQKIEPYFDIYKQYYNSRYPDRKIEFNLFHSTIIVKMKFVEKVYYIHMALIQYIVLDLIINNDGQLNVLEISKKSKIKIEHLQETINSLLQIKIIKHTNSKSIEELKFYINNDFTHTNNKISICSLAFKENTVDSKNTKEEYLHDRNTIILSNLYDYIKKNKSFVKDVLLTELEYKIPFKFTQEQIDNAIKTLIDKEHIIEISLPTKSNINNIDSIDNINNSYNIYKFVE